jgi:ferredoxin-NADP reductase
MCLSARSYWSKMAEPNFKSRLLSKIPRVEDVVSFQLERPRGYEYRAGQWFVISFPGPEEPYFHHFSHSNAPSETVLEFTTHLRDTEFKRALDDLPLGAEIELEGPYGTFTLPEEVEWAVFITGGIGITCVRSILRSLARDLGLDESAWVSDGPRSIVLLNANSSEQSIPFQDELAWLEGRIEGLRVVHVISQPEENWRGYRGHVDRGVFERELGNPQKWTFFVSGPPDFDQSTMEELAAWGVDDASITMEQFDGY